MRNYLVTNFIKVFIISLVIAIGCILLQSCKNTKPANCDAYGKTYNPQDDNKI